MKKRLIKLVLLVSVSTGATSCLVDMDAIHIAQAGCRTGRNRDKQTEFYESFFHDAIQLFFIQRSAVH